MGNSTSKAQQQAPRQNYASKKDDMDKKKHELKAELKKRQEEVKKIEETLASDSSLPTLMNILLQLLQKPNYDNLRKVIKQLGNSMSKMYGILPSLVEFAGPKMVDNMYELINEFSKLLRKSKKALVDVNEQAKIQQDNLEEILEMIDDMEDGENIDKTEWGECISTMSEWISDKSLNDILAKWNVFTDDCQKQQKAWEEKIQNSSSKRTLWIKRGIAIFGFLIGIGAIVALFIVCIPAALGVGSLVAVSGVLGTATIAKIGIFTGCGILFSGMLLSTSAIIPVQDRLVATQVYKRAIKVKKSILEMLAFGKQMQNNLSDLDIVKTTKISQHFELLKSKNGRKKIRLATGNLVNYLIEYQVEANKTILEITNCQKDSIKKLKKL